MQIVFSVEGKIRNGGISTEWTANEGVGPSQLQEMWVILLTSTVQWNFFTEWLEVVKMISADWKKK